MWHASTASPFLTVWELKLCALDALEAVGDQSKQWEEWTGKAYHIRRRLTPEEQEYVGPVVDIRADRDEVDRRLAPVRHILPPGWAE